MRKEDLPELLTPAEVATFFRVDPKTVTRWARAGKIQCLKTLGGHRRYLRTEIEGLLVEANGGRSPRIGTGPRV